MGLRSEAMKSLTAGESAVASYGVSGCQAVEGFAPESDSLTSLVSANAGKLVCCYLSPTRQHKNHNNKSVWYYYYSEWSGASLRCSGPRPVSTFDK